MIRQRTKVEVRLGGAHDVEAALAVYERSNLARRHGEWPSRDARLEHVTANLRDAASWFVVAEDGSQTVGMALVLPFRADRGLGPIMPGCSFLDLIYVDPDRWGEGIGGTLLDAVIEEAARRQASTIYLWTHELQNARAHRLYAGRGFARTGVTGDDEAGERVAEWRRDG
jgi:GNAT superfamily N-acetyltransferase